jgi:hypothetical protein
MEIAIDLNLNFYLNSLLELGKLPPIVITWIIFKNGGWIFVVWTFLWGFWEMWIDHKGEQYASSIKYVLLSFDVPKENEQSPKAIENIFSQLMGACSSVNLVEKYWQGKSQPKFSLEIISLEGYIQFLIRTPDGFRDLVEAAFYAQYPEVEITEVADYTQNVPIEEFPSEEYDLQGSEIILAKSDIYPIKTYPNFEHPLTQEFKDPMAALLEIFCKLQKGEQIWLQIIISPYLKDNKTLKEKGIKEINKIAGKKEVVHRNLSDKGVNLFMETLDKFGEIIYPLWKEHPSKDELPSLMSHLTSGEKFTIEAIEGKISKLSFKTKIRFIYLAKKEIFSSKRGVNPVFGAFQQFFGLNEFKPGSKSIIKNFYFFNKTRRANRKTRLFRNYKNRDRGAGANLFMLNTEELATIFHFPVMNVKTPLISKTISRTAEPPFILPIGDDDLNLDQTLEHKLRQTSKTQEKEKKEGEKNKQYPINLPTNEPPDNLPVK